MNTNLMASTAVFAELLNSKSDLKDIISQFILSVFGLEKEYSLDSTEVVGLLRKHFEFEIPEAVVKITMQKLSKEGSLEFGAGKFIINPDKLQSQNELYHQVQRKKNNQNQIEESLVEYFNLHSGKINSDIKQLLLNSFTNYVLDDKISDQYSAIVSSFIVKNSGNSNFLHELNLIREGITVLQGIKYTVDFNTIGHWKDELTIFLDTEHIFNILGFNGDLYQKILIDFYDLVRDINNIFNKKYNKKLIHLKYFDNVEEEIKNFFYVAVKIQEGRATLEPGKSAMEKIIKGSSERSDIVRKEAKLFTDLKTLNITKQEDINIYENADYNVEDSMLIEKYSGNHREDEIANVLKSFTKINFLREGKNNTAFERVKYIILTGSYLTLQLSRDLDVKNSSSDFSFATDIYFITNRLWFNLNKGLGSNTLPSSLDIATKARIILSTHLNNTVRDRFERIKSDFKNGIRTEEEIQDFYLNLRTKTSKPEEILPENVDEKVEFIFDNDIDKFIREQSLLKMKADSGEKYKELVVNYQKVITLKKEKKSRKKLIKAKAIARKKYLSLLTLFYASIFILIFIISYIIYKLKTENDTPLSLISFVWSLLPLLTLYKNKFIKQKINSYVYKGLETS